MDVLEGALRRGNLEIFNADQGAWFISPRFTKPLLEVDI